jgi:hypothetical protein
MCLPHYVITSAPTKRRKMSVELKLICTTASELEALYGVLGLARKSVGVDGVSAPEVRQTDP